MRLVYLNPCGQMGGAEICLIDMLVSIRAAEPEWQCALVLGEDGPLAERAKAAGVPVIVAPFPRMLGRLGDSGGSVLAALWQSAKAAAGAVRYAFELKRTLQQLQPDVIHTNGFKMHVLGAWARPRSVAVIWHVHDYVSTRPLMKHMLEWHANRVKAVIANSKSVASDVASVCGSRTETVCVYNGVDLQQYSPAGGAMSNKTVNLDALSGLEPPLPGTARVGLVATLAHWKGHAVFLRALARLPQDVRFRAYVIGGAIYQTENSQQTLGELRALAAELGIGEKVGFTGYVADPAGAIRALDILVHASTQPEPFGRVIAEGMACGKAVICASAGGAAELFTEGVDALGHVPGDEVGLAARITELLRDPELRERLGHAGRITAERRFDRSRLSRDLIPLYRRVSGNFTPQTQAQVAVTR